MTNQTPRACDLVLVPREPTDEMLKAIWDTQHDTGEKTWAAVLAAAPQPTALGGEPEYPAGAIHNGRAFIDQLESIYAFKEQQGHVLSLCSEWQELVRCFEYLVESIGQHRAHVASLLADIECLKYDCEVAHSVINAQKAHIAELEAAAKLNGVTPDEQ